MREKKEMQNVRLKERTGGIEKDLDDIMLYYRDIGKTNKSDTHAGTHTHTDR